MSVSIGDRVTILANTTHPKLAGRIGTVVSVTKRQPCGMTHDGRYRGQRCGNNPILEVEGVGRVLVPADAVTVVDAAGMVA